MSKKTTGGPGGGGSGRIRRQRRRQRTPAPGASERVRKTRGRSTSSQQWLARQINDPYVAEAKRRGYRSRAAFKLIEIDDKHRILQHGQRVIDLGAAPGGWCQVARERIGQTGRIAGLDLLPVEPLPDVTFLEGDITDAETASQLRSTLDGAADLVLSDMAPNATGHRPTDQARVLGVVEAALDLAEETLCPGGSFLAKTLQVGGAEELITRLRAAFDKVQFVKPRASRPDSAETYLLATGFHGPPAPETTGA